MNWLMVILGALVGAPLRYLIDRTVQARLGTAFPWGTFTVNLLACVALGLLAGFSTATTVPAALQHLIGTGLCATLSTYSTFSVETIRLTENGATLLAVANALGSVLAGLAALSLSSHLAIVLLS
ncbi:fluoride efflux transporter CrcB [Micromonospora sp. NPDC003816]|uniref:fluoride efflux transporter CrcB n=1 Tax=Micromonospora sp. NPDC003816 TaxID=3364224 RepID=UPI0036CC4966